MPKSARGLGCCAASLFVCALGFFLLAAPVGAQSASPPSQPEWETVIRQRVSGQDLPGALAATEVRLAEAPQDLDARGWRARILGWMGRWTEAEEDYRRVLKQAPNDVDILIGLANVLNAQQRSSDALVVLDDARALDAMRVDLHLTRGRTLRALDRRAEARDAFRAALVAEPHNTEAQQGLESVREEPRHRFTAGADVDAYNYTTQGAQAYTYGLRSAWRLRWTTEFGARFDHRWGATAGRWSGALAARLPRRSTLTVGGSAGPANGIVSKGEVFVDAGSGFTFDRRRLIRGIEANYQHRWLWFDGARILTLRPSALVYLPRDWTWSLAVTAARSRFSGLGAEWRPSAITRLTFPLGPQVSGHALFAAGTENYALRDQIGRFSAQTYGGGVRIQLPRRQQLSGYFAYQHRTQGRTQKSVGFAHAIRF